MFRALNHFFDDESVGEMGFSMSANAIGCKEFSFTVSIDRVGLVVAIDADDLGAFQG